MGGEALTTDLCGQGFFRAMTYFALQKKLNYSLKL